MTNLTSIYFPKGKQMRERISRRYLNKQNTLVLLEVALVAAVEHGRLRTLLTELLTREHLNTIAQRLHIAHLLFAGHSYRGIEDNMRVSSKTIATVDRWLRRENPHYRRLYPIRHKRRYRNAGQFSNAPLFLSPFNMRGRVNALFGLDVRQR